MRLGHRQHKEMTMWRYREKGSHLQAKERSLGRNQLCQYLALSPGLQNCEKRHFWCVHHPIWGILLWKPCKVIHCPSFKDQLKCQSSRETPSPSQISPPSVLLLLLPLCHSASFRITFAHTSPRYVVTSWEWSPCLIHFFPLQHFSLRRPGGLNEWLLK